jgi:hypothetical protein
MIQDFTEDRNNSFYTKRCSEKIFSFLKGTRNKILNTVFISKKRTKIKENTAAYLNTKFNRKGLSVPWALLLARGKLTLVPLVGQTATKR